MTDAVINRRAASKEQEAKAVIEQCNKRPKPIQETAEREWFIAQPQARKKKN